MQTNSRWSGPPVREVVWEAVQEFTGGDVNVEFAIKDIEAVALERYPDFKVSNVGAEITAGCVNSASRHHHSPDIDRYWKVARGVYRLYESDQPVDLDDVLEKINEIAKESATGDYIYRGEPAHHQKEPYFGKVSSGLYRPFLKKGQTDVNVEGVQYQNLMEARKYIPDEMDEFKLLATLQHFGAKTNLIDFTTDYLVALFFACDGKPDEDGRVILLEKEPESVSEPYYLQDSPRIIRRAEAQKSIFVQAPKGFVEPDKVVSIPKSLKNAMLDHLNKHHGISTPTIYNDLHGYIEIQRLHEEAYTAFHEGFTSQGRGDSADNEKEKQEYYHKAIGYYTDAITLKYDLIEAYDNRGFAYHNIGDFDLAIRDYNKAIDLEPKYANAYDNRGFAYRNKGNFDKAIEDYSKAIELEPENANTYNNRGLVYHDRGYFEAAIDDYNKAIDLDPEDAQFYSNRGEAWLHLKEWQKAKADLMTAKNMGCDIIASFQNDYESVEDFEAKNGVKMPEDIAALLLRK